MSNCSSLHACSMYQCCVADATRLRFGSANQVGLIAMIKVTYVPLPWAVAPSSRVGDCRWNRGMRASPHIALVDLVAGSRARVVSVPDRDADRLAAEGLQPGGELELEALLPLGGPIVVRIGRARVALARQVAAAIAVEPRSPRAPDRPRP